MTAAKKRRKRGAGRAYLVGAGPGDPGLMTVRGMELLRNADAVVYDALANPELLREAGIATGIAPELHDVGKRGGDVVGSARQEEINDLLVQLVRRGRQVVRLKGGDPLVFGRGGEEAQALAEAGLPFEIVPGITSGIAAPAYAGIPVTHRGLSTSVTLVTGHEDPMKGAPAVDWGALARTGGTIVLYMGVKKLPDVTAALMSAGMPGEMPAAAIQWGTTGQQRTVVATLDSITDRVADAGLGAPAITVIGWSVVLRDEIAWFDQRPLFGQRILVTRAADSSARSTLSTKLRAEGAQVVELPATRLVPLDATPLRERIRRISDYQWIIFTSANAVSVFWNALGREKLDARALGGIRVCVVGPGTAAALLERGIVADVSPAKFAAEGVVAALADRDDLSGSLVLYPCAEGARETLKSGLESLGARVDRVHTYRSEPDPATGALLKAEVERGELTLAAFTSASAVRAYLSAVGEALAASVGAASIGPVTTVALQDAGMRVVTEAEDATLDALTRAIVLHAGPDLPLHDATDWEDEDDNLEAATGDDAAADDADEGQED